MAIPTTAMYASFLGLLLLALSYRVVMLRQKFKVGIGSGGNADIEHAMRVQANFIEYMPLTLILLIGFELHGAESWLVHSLAGLFVVARVWHAWDFARNPAVSTGRTWGTMLTWMIIVALCVGNIWYSIDLRLS